MEETSVQTVEAVPWKKRVERAAGRIGLWLIVKPLRAMPMPMARFAGACLGAMLYRVLGRYRCVAHKNLTLIYGAEKSPNEITQMAKAVFRHFGEIAGEFVKLPQLDRAMADRLVEVEGEENLKRAYEPGNGILLVTGHFGNWEMMARWLTSHGYTLNVVARDARDPQASKLLEETRQGSGANVFYRGGSARAILQCLKRNELFAILPDQNAVDVFAPFFGHPTGTADGVAVLHFKTKAPLLFTWCVRLPDGRYRLTFEPPEVVPASADKQADILRVMTLVNARLEAQIRQNPTQWLWLHDRWKASPGVFPEGEENARLMKMSRNEYLRERGARSESPTKGEKGELGRE